MNKQELGLQIKDFEDYVVTSEGEIWSLKLNKARKLKPQKASQSKKKYLQVRLFNKHTRRGLNLKRENKKRQMGKLHYVHRLVYEHFIGKIPEGLEIDHKDGNPHNNSVDNLQTITRRQNILKYQKPDNKKNFRNHRDEIIEDYKKLKSMPLVAKKWNTSKGIIRRVLKNVFYNKKSVNGVIQYTTTIYDDSLPKDKWMLNDLRDISISDEKFWL